MSLLTGCMRAPDVTGFSSPESVLYDSASDTYLVSNINGDAFEADDNGFISRVSPEGEILELKFIDGANETIDLDGPKGLTLVGDTLYATDITVVRMFDRTTGEALSTVEIPDAQFLNDVAAGPDGTVYVTDSFGGAIHRIRPDGSTSVVTEDPDLGLPNGITVLNSGDLMVVTFGNSSHVVDASSGEILESQTYGALILDGVEQGSDGTVYISSWSNSSVFKVTPEGEVETEVRNVASPGDIGLDPSRDRLLIPLVQNNGIIIDRIAQSLN